MRRYVKLQMIYSRGVQYVFLCFPCYVLALLWYFKLISNNNSSLWSLDIN